MAKCRWKGGPDAMHPCLYFKVLLSGSGKTWKAVKAEIRGVLELVEQLERDGSRICDRDGAHVFYDVAPGKRDPLR